MATDSPNEVRLNFRLPAELKTTIEEAAACLGQSVSDFAISSLAQTARSVIEQTQVTRSRTGIATRSWLFWTTPMPGPTRP